MRRFLLILMAVLPVASLAACDDTSSAFGAPSLSGDSTLVPRAPTFVGADVASALDATVPAAVAPELPQYAGQWDFALRQNGSTFRLVTLDTGSPVSRPGLAPRQGVFTEIEEASRRRSEYSDSTVTINEGSVFTFRTRFRNNQCFSYGKLRVVDLDVALGTARFDVVVNRNCDDERLIPDD